MAILHPMVNIAVKAARRAGRIINQAAGNLDVLTVRHKSLNDLVSEVDRASEEAIIETLQSGLPGPRDSSRRERCDRPVRPRLGHRSARRHHQLLARIPAVRGVHRAAAQGRHHARRHLRPMPQRPVHRLTRPRRLPQRQATARFASREADRLAHRHRLPVSHVRASRRLHRHAQRPHDQDRGRPPARLGSAGSRQRGGRASGRHSGRSAWRPGTWRPAA